MTREEAERLVTRGIARWEGSTLVFLRPPLPLRHGGKVVEFDMPLEPTQVRWPGWERSPDGTWTWIG